MKRGGIKYSDNVKEDRLSDLSDCVILHILSFLDVKCVVQTCILSKRWNNLWKHLPTLILNSSHFMSIISFNNFVSSILSLRNASTPLRALDFERHGIVEPCLLQRIFKYAFSHHVQELSISISCDIQDFPTCFFSCHTLTSLTLVLVHPTTIKNMLFPSSLNFPALATLSLGGFIFRVGDDGFAEPFSAFRCLNSLIIRYCRVLNGQNLCISSATLANLTLKTYRYQSGIIELSTPSLCTFVFGCMRDIPNLKLRGRESNLSSIKHVNIDLRMGSIDADTPLVLLNWLVEFTNIKSLTINHNALEVFSSKFDVRKY